MSVAYLDLDRNRAGAPHRLRLKCNYEHNYLAKMVETARWQKSKAWTFPVDPSIVRRLLGLFGTSLELSADLSCYLEALYLHQQAVLRATQDDSPDGSDLWSFQRASVRFLVQAQRSILGHEMGTGKTPSVCVALDRVAASRVLIVCPDTIKWTWVDHLVRWCDSRTLYVLESQKRKVSDNYASILQGSKPKRDDLLAELLASRSEATLIINYDQARSHREVLDNYDYDVIVVDEAHRINNRKAQSTQAVVDISARCKYVWLLSGTPIRNNYDDLYQLLAICDPLRFTSYWNFIDLYLDSTPGFHGGVEVHGVKDTEQFQSMLSTYMFRLTKKEALPHLPKKVYSTLRLKLTPQQQTVYELMEKEFIAYITQHLETGEELEDILLAPNTVAQMMRLRQICLTPALIGGTARSAKLDAIDNLLEDLRGQQIIIFSNFRKFLYFIKLKLEQLHIEHGLIVGGQTSYQRDQVVKQFDNRQISVVLGTMRSMGEGLNLQVSSAAIFTDRDWVPAVNLQAEDRIHRGDITSSPTIIDLYHPGTIEDDIRATCKRKERIARVADGVNTLTPPVPRRTDVVQQMLKRYGR